MDYTELLRVTGDMLNDVKGAYSGLRFGEAIDVYKQAAEMYAEFLGLDIRDAGVIAYLMQSVAINR